MSARTMVHENHGAGLDINSADSPLTVAICSNRLEEIVTAVDRHLACTQECDEVLVVLDCEASTAVYDLVKRLLIKNVTVVTLGIASGLSRARNVALTSALHGRVVFTDDDVEFGPHTLNAIRSAFQAGFQIVGVRVLLPETVKLPWFVSDGQLHYLSVHSPWQNVKVWGACMGIDGEMAVSNNILFDPELGRQNGWLLSGEDTTFIQKAKDRGAKEKILIDSCVVHHIAQGRLSLGYMLRRAYWQGRSEAVRHQCRLGLKKEVKRYLSAHNSWPRKWILAVTYSIAFVAGALRERLSFAHSPWKTWLQRFIT